MTGMVKNRHLAKHVMDAKRLVSFDANWNIRPRAPGARLHVIDRAASMLTLRRVKAVSSLSELYRCEHSGDHHGPRSERGHQYRRGSARRP